MVAFRRTPQADWSMVRDLLLFLAQPGVVRYTDQARHLAGGARRGVGKMTRTRPQHDPRIDPRLGDELRLAGGDWATIQQIINEVTPDLEIVVYYV